MDSMMFGRQNDSRGSSGYSSDSESDHHFYKPSFTTRGRPRRRDRTLFTPEDLDILETFFLLDKYPDVRQREKLAMDLGVTEDRIQVWFQNRRSRAKKDHKRRVLVAQRLSTIQPSRLTPTQLPTHSLMQPTTWNHNQPMLLRYPPYFVPQPLPLLPVLSHMHRGVHLYNNAVFVNKNIPAFIPQPNTAFMHPPNLGFIQHSQHPAEQYLPQHDNTHDICVKSGIVHSDNNRFTHNCSDVSNKKFVPKRPWEDDDEDNDAMNDVRKKLKFGDEDSFCEDNRCADWINLSPAVFPETIL